MGIFTVTTDPVARDGFTDERDYIRVTPSTEALVPDQATRTLRKCTQLAPTDDGGLLTRPDPPTIEILLVSPRDSSSVEYLFGTADGDVDSLERVLDVQLPNTYRTTHTSTALANALTASTDGTHDTPPLTDRAVSGLEVHATESQPGAWRTRLTPFEAFHDESAAQESTWPLIDLVTTLSNTDAAVVGQTLLQPRPDWSDERDHRIWELRNDRGGTAFDRLWDSLETDTERARRSTKHHGHDEPLPPDVEARIEELQAVDPRHSFTVNTRVLAFLPPDHDAPLAGLRDAFAEVGNTGYGIDAAHYPADSDAAHALAADLAGRTVRNETRGRALAADWPVVGPFTSATQPGIVADPTTAGAFCLLGGAALPEAPRRALGTRSTDKVPTPRPAQEVLEQYRTPGYRLGHPIGPDEATPEAAIALAPDHLRRHVTLVGQTGAGKGVLSVRSLVANHAATDGATVIIETKDGEFADLYCRAHYATHGTLEDVYRFDAHEHLPAAPVFDIEPAMASGLSRTQAISAMAARIEAMLQGVMGTDEYEAASTSSRVIRAVLKASFDPVHGETQLTLHDLKATLDRMAQSGTTPPVMSDRLRRTLADIVANSDDTRTEIIQAAKRRLDELLTYEQLAPQFEFVPDAEADERVPGDRSQRTVSDGAGGDGRATAGSGPTRFDWRAKLDEDCVIIIDSSSLMREPQRVLTLLTLAQCWTALRRRRREHRATDRAARGDLAQVTLHVEEAADVAAAGVLDRLLSKGRGYGVGVSLSLQFLKQLEQVDPSTYAEAINNTGTTIAGQINHDRTLARSLATDEVGPDAIANRLRALESGEWLCSLPATYGETSPAPFTITTGALPTGHPDGPAPLSEARETTLEAARLRRDRRSERYALSVAESHEAMAPDTDMSEADPSAPDASRAAGTTAASAPPENAGRPTIDTTGPLTNVLPDPVTFDGRRNAWCCRTCENAYRATSDGLRDAIRCHGSLDAVSRDAFPTVRVDCTVSRSEREQTPYDDHQFAFMQLLYNVRRDQYDHETEFDLVWDDMERLLGYAGLDEAGLAELVTDGLVVKDTTEPQTMYSLTAEGRSTIDAAHRDGVAHGDGAGDLSESNYHRMLVEAITRGVRRQFVADPTHPATTVEPYYGVADGRLDVAALDDDGEVVVAAEAERSNHDTLRAVPSDYDKMAAQNPEDALWVVPSREGGHEILRVLNNPPEGEPRVPKTYNSDTYLPRLAIDQPGLTAIMTIRSFRNQYLDGGYDD